MADAADALTDSPSKGAQTRERILEIAERAVMDKGFAGTSIDEIIFEAGITKSGFIYHFRDKNQLARALLVRYLEQDGVVLDRLFERGDELHEDPLHAFLIGLKLFAEMTADLENGHPGCLMAAIVMYDRQFDAEVRRMTAEASLAWRARFRTRLGAIAARYPPRVEVDLDALADMVSVVVDGGILLSKNLKDGKLLARQVMLYRAFVRQIFLG